MDKQTENVNEKELQTDIKKEFILLQVKRSLPFYFY